MMADDQQVGLLRKRKRMVDARRASGEQGISQQTGETGSPAGRSGTTIAGHASAAGNVKAGNAAEGDVRATTGANGPETETPEDADRRQELERLRYRRTFWSLLRSTIYSLIVVAAIAVLISNQLFPVLRIYGHSMNDTLDEGELVIALKSGEFAIGDVVAFYYNNKLLVKRVIGVSGDWIDIDQDGTVYVNNKKIDEPYIEEKAYGETNIELPYQVPESRIFVMGDNRSVSVDSRNTAVGCVAEEQIVGRIVFRIWPLEMVGRIN